MLALCLTRLSTDRVRRERLGRSWRCTAPEGRAAAGGDGAPAPLALYRTVANANRLTALCETAEAGGLAPGLGLAEAKARFPGLEVLEADPAADRRLLEAVADWCDRYTPLVALDPPHGLVLDISGCAHLFGGERGLLDDLLARLFHQGFAASAAIAGHAGTALALAAHRPGLMVGAGAEIAAIGDLPVAALRLEPELAATLLRLGLTTLGALLALPRAALARRFGADLLLRLDRAAGRADRPIGPRRPVPLLIAERRLFEPVSRTEDVEAILLALAERLRGDLERRGEGARRLELSLFRVDGQVARLTVGTSEPQRDPRRIQSLFRERLAAVGDELDAGFGYDLVKLTVLQAEGLADRQEDLSRPDADDRTVVTLLDRLGARLGEASVLRLSPVASHWPERAQDLAPAVAGPAAAASGEDERLWLFTAPRPLRLLADPEPVEAVAEVPEGPPIRFRWRRALHGVRRSEGPERIEPEWWRASGAAARDYFRVEDEEGRRYWLFREGFYGRGEVEPAWYLHGFFA
ncbi:DNA polymerase Y family protein [Aurantimonas sp. MSK8Z-1]|uniref:Y-family DNA polymerase n=1 Tax=Mangrovibrevibacter kandeliae TaxID=2968473 RepID=UPI002118E0A0|nr:DNA polymerase Y family protein [Aurantimonas sp. MSK8Z-1]MCW4116454.1 DNA polymerase Y family protein [Aurantimonas sp. MSK8Z-1]